MRHIIAALRIIAILLVTSLLSGVWFLGKVLFWRSDLAQQRLRRRVVNAWARGLCLIMAIEIVQEGQPPEPPFCLVSNHLSYVDVLVLHATSRGRLISRADVKDWPLIGMLADIFGTIFIDRNRTKDVQRVVNVIAETINSGDGVTFFPEGTSTNGEAMKPFKTSLLEYSARTESPVHFATINYCTRPGDPPASRAICWWGEMTFTSHAYRLMTLRGCSARVTYGDEPVREQDRKTLARQLHSSMASQFQPTD